jgi:hypothetical protein
MGGMPDWFAKSKEMVASDQYFSLEAAGSPDALVGRYLGALARLDATPSGQAPQRSDALEKVWGDQDRVDAALGGHFVGDWIHSRYYEDTAQFESVGGKFWPVVPSRRVADLVREGTRLAIHKALGETALANVPGLSAAYLTDLWGPEKDNGIEIDGVRSLATSWNCVSPEGSDYFEVAVLRGPSVVEFCIATPKPLGSNYGHSSVMVIEKVLDGSYG